MTILEKIEAHKQAILSSQVPEDLTTCPCCHQSPPEFKLHDVRQRSFRVIIENLVHLVQGFLARWKCTLCKHSFTWYPDFAIAYKRYVKDSIVKLSSKYVEDDKTTYNQTVQHQSSFIAYTTDKEIQEPCLAGSTVHRWLELDWRNSQRTIKPRTRPYPPERPILQHLQTGLACCCKQIPQSKAPKHSRQRHTLSGC